MISSPTPPPLQQVRAIVDREDWTDPQFSRSKAYVCAIFSELAYWYIPVFELEHHDRVKVIPSSAYQELWPRLAADDFFTRMLRENDFAPTVLDRRLAVVVIVPTNRVIFVAIRGTVNAYDWMVNAQAWKRVGYHRGVGHFHRGFYGAVESVREELYAELSKHDATVPVYVTGHSLGGAMAAIIHAISCECRCGIVHVGVHETHSSYTYGMPRYADRKAVTECRGPYHVLKADDVVPRVPPRWLGYADPLTEFEAGGTVARVKHRDAWPFPTWIATLAFKKTIERHVIERYRLALAR